VFNQQLNTRQLNTFPCQETDFIIVTSIKARYLLPPDNIACDISAFPAKMAKQIAAPSSFSPKLMSIKIINTK
jgi:hypothetical protein